MISSGYLYHYQALFYIFHGKNSDKTPYEDTIKESITPNLLTLNYCFFAREKN